MASGATGARTEGVDGIDESFGRFSLIGIAGSTREEDVLGVGGAERIAGVRGATEETDDNGGGLREKLTESGETLGAEVEAFEAELVDTAIGSAEAGECNGAVVSEVDKTTLSIAGGVSARGS